MSQEKELLLKEVKGQIEEATKSVDSKLGGYATKEEVEGLKSLIR